MNLHGLLGPVVTTFQAESGEIDRLAFENNIRSHLTAGLHGVVVTGSTGEAALLDDRERATLVEAARDVVPSDRILIAGTGAESTRTCLRHTHSAAQRGADAVLVVAPHYYGAKLMTSAALRAHYLVIADKSPVPVVLYNIPKYMHFSFAPQLVAELARHENIVGMKDSSGDLELLSEYLHAQSERFSVMTGNGSTFKSALEIHAALARGTAASASEKAVADRAQQRLTPLSSRIVGDMGVPGIKAALDRVGLTGGPVRSPLQPLSNSELGQLTELLQAAQLPLAA
ncbi:MAG TPA: dihydrodipicolinate synthase family protein [Gemmatimonadales bacterium]|nr:dihydrodipicolinate synthase family protein [Gemmatimonadales bacterium]